MTILGKYLFKRIILITLISLFAITLLLFFMQATKYLDLIVSKGLQIKYLFYITILSMPAIWNELLPITIFIAIVFTWQMMIHNNEMIIMQVAGLSSWQISRPVILIGSIAAIICFFFSLFIINSSYLEFLKLRDNIKNNFNIRIIGNNKFMQLTPDLTIYIDKTTKNGLLKNVLIDNQTIDNEYAIYAESARVLKEGKTLKILLNNGSLQKLDKLNKTVNFINFDFYILTVPESKSNEDDYARISARKMYLWELIFYDKLSFMQTLKNNNYNEYKNKISTFISEVNKRLSNVVLSIAFAVIAAFFFSRSAFNRRTQFLPLFKSLLAGIILKLFCISVLISTSSILTIGISYLVIFFIIVFMFITIIRK